MKPRLRGAIGKLLPVASLLLTLADHCLAQSVDPSLVPNIFAPRSSHADALFRYDLLILGITGAIFLVVASLLAYAVVRFRQRPGDETVEPPQVYGSDQVEIAWTVIPVLIVVTMALATARTVYQVTRSIWRPPATAICAARSPREFGERRCRASRVAPAACSPSGR